MIDVFDTIIPRSDQLNSDALLEPKTITVTRVTKIDEADQPLVLNYEGDKGQPYKPCKSMRRVLAHCWGRWANEWVGKSMTLFNDPTVKWGGIESGGVRISHVSHIQRTTAIPLRESSKKKTVYTVKPLQVQQPARPAAPPTAPEPPPVSPPLPAEAPPAEPPPTPRPPEQLPQEQPVAPSAAEAFVDATEESLRSVHGGDPGAIIDVVERILREPKFKARGEKLRLGHKPLYTRLIKAFAHPEIVGHAQEVVNGQYEVFYFDLIKEAESQADTEEAA